MDIEVIGDLNLDPRDLPDTSQVIEKDLGRGRIACSQCRPAV